jgi:hypothetical protein
MSRVRSFVYLMLALTAGSAACRDGRSPVAPPAAVAGSPRMVGDLDPRAPGIFTGWSSAQCLDIDDGNDADHDGVVDLCERIMAAAFAPELRFSSDCIIDSDDVLGLRLGGDYGYAVQQIGGAMRIAYLPAYYADCGAPAGIDGGFNVFGDGHSGDSEMIIVETRYSTASNHWQTVRVFTSSHCGEPGRYDAFLFDYCAFHPASNFSFVGGLPQGAPVVWVSNRKHANYWSRSRCDRGIIDECYDHYVRRFPIMNAGQNIGSGDFPNPWRAEVPGQTRKDCQPPLFSSATLLRYDPTALSRVECWWAKQISFNGWMYEIKGGATAYGYHLQYYAGMQKGQSVFPPKPGDVQISGSTAAQPGQRCGYFAYVEDLNGDFPPPYGFAWGTDGLWYGSGESFTYTHTESSERIHLRVTNASGTVRETSLLVTVGDGAACLMLGDELS